MHLPKTQTLAILILSSRNALVSGSQAGDTGILSSLHGGLGGTITVIDSETLLIINYKLSNASAPELYWWGSPGTAQLDSGFRICNSHVTMPASSDRLAISLDAGKTSADFDTAGLWCEKLQANFGQAELKAANGSDGGSSGSQGDSKGNTGSISSVNSTLAAVAGILGFSLAMW